MLGDVLSIAPIDGCESAGMNDVEVPFIRFDDVISDYEKDQFFGHVLRAMKDEWPFDQKQKFKIEKLLPKFTKKGKRFFISGKTLRPAEMCIQHSRDRT